MKRLHVVLIGLAVLSLIVAGAWAAEETSWAEVKSLTDPQPAAKAAVRPVLFYTVNGPVFVEPGEVRLNEGGRLVMATGFVVTWDVEGDLTGTLTITGGHSFANSTANRGQENFYARFEVTYEGLSGVFEGRVEDRMVLMESTDASFALHGSGGFTGMTLRGRMALYDIPPNLSFVWEGEILAPHGWPAP